MGDDSQSGGSSPLAVGCALIGALVLGEVSGDAKKFCKIWRAGFSGSSHCTGRLIFFTNCHAAALISALATHAFRDTAGDDAATSAGLNNTKTASILRQFDLSRLASHIPYARLIILLGRWRNEIQPTGHAP
jgi:hypothetical protein